MKESIIEIIKTIAKMNGARFVSLTYKAKGTGEVARHRLLLGVNIEKAYRRDLSVMRRQLPRCKTTIEREACEAIVASLAESLKVGIGNNSAYTQKGQWANLLPGLRQNIDNGTLHVYGFSRGKTVIQPGVYKPVNSAPLTIAKDTLRKRMKINRFRAFTLEPETLQTMRAQGNVIEIN